MAYITDNRSSLVATVSGFATTISSTISTFMADLISANARSSMIQELHAMDDATLKAKHGITRSQIVNYVFRDKLLY